MKTTDEHGNLVEEKVGDEKFDDDSEILCREIVKKLVSLGAVNFIIRFLCWNEFIIDFLKYDLIIRLTLLNII